MTKKDLLILKEFLDYCKKELAIEELPKITLTADKNYVRENRSFASYDVNTGSIVVYYKGRNLADVCRSLAHELTHHRQKELGLLKGLEDGKTGSEIENDANAMAGIIMRDFGKLNLDVYQI